MLEPLGSDPLAERARVSPEDAALVRAADGERWTYADLDAAVEETAGQLSSLGVGPGDHVGLLAGTDVPAIRTIYAALRLGAVAVPLNVRLTAAELAPQLEIADVDLLVCEADAESLAAAAAATAADAAESARDLEVATLDDPADRDDPGDEPAVALADRSPDPFDASTPAADDVRLLLFTSGTTGEPKAVELTARNLRSSALASALRLGVDPDDRWFVPLATCHMGGFAPVYRSILYGTTVVLQREFDAAATLERLREREATCLSVVPTMLRRLLDASDDRSDDAPDEDPLADLRFVLSGGAATPPELVERCSVRGVPLCPTYGSTETASQVATALPDEAREFPGTVGRPLLPVEVTILDDDGDPIPPGEGRDPGREPRPGEVVVDGPTVSPGYYGDPEATEASRSAHGYHTGDLGYRDEGGRLWVLGRADDRIVTGGEVVHPAEVAAAIRERDGVDDVAVVGLADEEWGERVGAVVAGEGIDPGDVRAHCEGRLAGYKHPRVVAVVGELPRTPSGTVDREAVRAVLREEGVEV